MDELGRRAAGEGPPPAGPAAAPYDAPAEAAPYEAPAEAPAAPVAGADDDDMYESRFDANGDAVMRLKPAAVAELYSPPRVTATLPRLGLVAGATVDLRADEAGGAWDFTKQQDRKRAWERIRAEEPFLVVGSPPCTMFSRLNLNLNARKMGKDEWERRRREAEVLLIFAAAVYGFQVQAGRHFLHEHPAGSTSWHHPAIARL